MISGRPLICFFWFVRWSIFSSGQSIWWSIRQRHERIRKKAQHNLVMWFFFPGTHKVADGQWQVCWWEGEGLESLPAVDMADARTRHIGSSATDPTIVNQASSILRQQNSVPCRPVLPPDQSMEPADQSAAAARADRHCSLLGASSHGETSSYSPSFPLCCPGSA